MFKIDKCSFYYLLFIDVSYLIGLVIVLVLFFCPEL